MMTSYLIICYSRVARLVVETEVSLMYQGVDN